MPNYAYWYSNILYLHTYIIKLFSSYVIFASEYLISPYLAMNTFLFMHSCLAYAYTLSYHSDPLLRTIKQIHTHTFCFQSHRSLSILHRSSFGWYIDLTNKQQFSSSTPLFLLSVPNLSSSNYSSQSLLSSLSHQATLTQFHTPFLTVSFHTYRSTICAFETHSYSTFPFSHHLGP